MTTSAMQSPRTFILFIEVFAEKGPVNAANCVFVEIEPKMLINFCHFDKETIGAEEIVTSAG